MSIPRYQLFHHARHESPEQGQRLFSISRKTVIAYSTLDLAITFARVQKQFPNYQDRTIYIKDNFTRELFDTNGNKLLL